MIIQAVQDDYIELRISLTDSQSGDMVALNSGEKLEFVSNVRTTEYEEDTDGKKGKTQIGIQSKVSVNMGPCTLLLDGRQREE